MTVTKWSPPRSRTCRHTARWQYWASPISSRPASGGSASTAEAIVSSPSWVSVVTPDCASTSPAPSVDAATNRTPGNSSPWMPRNPLPSMATGSPRSPSGACARHWRIRCRWCKAAGPLGGHLRGPIGEIEQGMRLTRTESGPEEMNGGRVLSRQTPQKGLDVLPQLPAIRYEVAELCLGGDGKRPTG